MAANPGLVSVLDLITEALSLLGVYAPGEPIAAADSQSCLFTLAGLLDGWGAEPLVSFRGGIASFATVAGKQTYNVGPASITSPAMDWVLDPLPPLFGTITHQPAAAPGAGYEIPIAIVTDEQWADIALKSLANNYLSAVWPNYQAAGYFQLSFFPVPSSSFPVLLYAGAPVGRLASTSAALQLPPGYQEALTYELAIKVQPKFGAPLPGWLPAAWAEAKTKIKAANFQALDVDLDPALSSDGARYLGGGSLDFYTGR